MAPGVRDGVAWRAEVGPACGWWPQQARSCIIRGMNADERMKGKTVVITGAASGIGRALARRFARAGSRVGLLDLDLAGAEKVAAELPGLGGEGLPLSCDVTSWEQCQAAMAAVIETYGGIDVLVNNAGIAALGHLADTDMDIYRRVFDVNLFGAIHSTKAALESVVERRGTVVAISSVAGFAPLTGRTAYSASKHALHGLFGTLRTEIHDAGARVLIVCPGFTDTNIEARPTLVRVKLKLR